MLTKELNTLTNNTKSTESVLKCKICGKGVKDKLKLKQHLLADHERKFNCNHCGECFHRSCDLEHHLTVNHKEVKHFQCNDCGMTFMFEWRLRKHTKGHKSDLIRTCHFFNNGKSCPFQAIGCKFRHEEAPMCKERGSCSMNMCQYGCGTEPPWSKPPLM